MSDPNNKQTIALKTVGPNSAKELSILWQQTFREAYINVHSANDIEKYCKDNYTAESARDALANQENHCRIAYRYLRAVGFYMLKQNTCPLQPELNACELKQLYLLASEYGTGLANILFADLVNHAKTKRIAAIWLGVSDKNFRAKSYYRKLGFFRLGDGPLIPVGQDTLTSSILLLHI